MIIFDIQVFTMLYNAYLVFFITALCKYNKWNDDKNKNKLPAET
jgi:hypothetical protein